MNEFEQVKKSLDCEIENSVNAIIKNYPNKEGFEYDIILHIISKKLHEIQFDSEHLSFVDFFKEYLNGTLFLDCEDFTISEREKIIKESPLSDRDRKLASSYFLEMKSEDTIANDLCIDRKTVRSNIPKISLILKRTAMIMYKK